MQMIFEKGIEANLAYHSQLRNEDQKTLTNRILKLKQVLAESKERNSLIIEKALDLNTSVVIMCDFKTHQSLLKEMLGERPNVFCISTDNWKAQQAKISEIDQSEKKIMIVTKALFEVISGVNHFNNSILINTTYTLSAGLFERSCINSKFIKVIQIADKTPLFKTLNNFVAKLSANHRFIDVDYMNFLNIKKWCR